MHLRRQNPAASNSSSNIDGARRSRNDPFTAPAAPNNSSNIDDGIARIIDPPTSISRSLSNELYSPTTIAKVTSLAFPEYDETETTADCNHTHDRPEIDDYDDDSGVSTKGTKMMKQTTPTKLYDGTTTEFNNNQGAQYAHHHRGQHHDLTKYDIYPLDFIPCQHTFTIVLSDDDGGGGASTSGSRSGTKVFGHVRHYLPPLSRTTSGTTSWPFTNTTTTTTTTTASTTNHHIYHQEHNNTSSRIDIGRRKYRAMVLLTRAPGGIGFYSNVLKTAEAIALQSRIISTTTTSTIQNRNLFDNNNNDDDDPIRSYLHALFQKHATLIAHYAELRRYGLGLNFLDSSTTLHSMVEQKKQQQQQQSPLSISSSGTSLTPCEAARSIMEKNEFLFRITLDGIEFGGVEGGRTSGAGGGGLGGDGIGNTSWRKNPSDQGKRSSKNMITRNGNEEDVVDATTISTRRIVEKNDTLQFYLPHSLQPGFDALSSELIPEDIAHPMLPLLLCIKTKNFVRLLSALLCEVRIVFVSACATRLSSCVRAASSMIAQGLLVWEHICIPVVPPSMLKSVLCAESPYLVGILINQASRVRKLLGKSISDVLYVNLDSNEMLTLNMSNPRLTVPDLLKKVGGNIGSGGSQSQKFASEYLAIDLDEILKAEQILLGEEIVAGGSGTSEMMRDSNGKRLDESITPVTSSSDGKHPGKTTNSSNNAVRYMTLLERREYASSVDAAAAFGKLIRTSFFADATDDDDALENEDAQEEHRQRSNPPTALMYSATSLNNDVESFVAENEHGEECIRSALTSFFVHLYGDMGMYLSESRGSFLLDRRKFLLRKEQLGEKVGSPTYLVLQKLSASRMFAAHASGRVEDISMRRDRSNIMPRKLHLQCTCNKDVHIVTVLMLPTPNLFCFMTRSHSSVRRLFKILNHPPARILAREREEVRCVHASNGSGTTSPDTKYSIGTHER